MDDNSTLLAKSIAEIENQKVFFLLTDLNNNPFNRL